MRSTHARTTSSTTKQAKVTRGRAVTVPTHTPAGPVEASLLRGAAQAVNYMRGALEEPVRVTRVPLTARNTPAVRPAPVLSATAVKAIRSAYGMSQPVFAQVLNVSPETVKGWEQGKKRPDGPARRLLEVVQRHPDLVDELTNDARGAGGASA